MLDLKTPFNIRDSAITPYQPELVLADLPGLSAVLLMPDVHDLDAWAASIERANPIVGSDEEFFEATRYGLEYELRSMEEVSDEYGHMSGFRAKMADLVEEVGSFEGAKKFSMDLLNDSPSSASAYRMARLLVEEGDLDGAKGILEKHTDTLDYFGLLRLAQVYALSGLIENSRTVVERAITIQPTDYRGWMFSGSLAMAIKDWQSALQSFRAAAEEPNNSSTLHVNLAYTYMATGQDSRALKELRIASRINPADKNAIVLFCDLALDLESPEIAKSAVDMHFEAGGRSSEFLERAARLCFSIGDRQSQQRDSFVASKKYLSSLLGHEDKAQHWNNLGVVEARLGNRARALKHFSHAVKQAETTEVDWSLPLSNILVDRIREREYALVEKATRELFDSTRIQQQKYWQKIALQRCSALEGLGRRDSAAAFIESLLDVPMEDEFATVEMLSSLVNHFSSMRPAEGKIESYLVRLRTAADSAGGKLGTREYIRVFNNLAFAYLQVNDLDNARAVLDKLRSVAKDDPYVTATIGLERLKSGRPDRAKDLYSEAVSKAPDRKLKERLKQRMRLEMSRYFASIGDLDQARKFALASTQLKLGFSDVDSQANELLKLIGKP